MNEQEISLFLCQFQGEGVVLEQKVISMTPL